MKLKTQSEHDRGKAYYTISGCSDENRKCSEVYFRSRSLMIWLT